MLEELQEVVEEWREKDADLSDEEAYEVYRLCLRKMEVAKTEDTERYIFLLFPDEIKNYLYRRAVNATTVLRKKAKEMCCMCLQNPCHPRCPNAPKPEPLMKCVECGDGIYAGDDYYDIGNGLGICKECMDEKSTSELMELFGESFSVAS